MHYNIPKLFFLILLITPSMLWATHTGFTEHVISTSANSAQNVHAADVDSDGDMDVLSASREGDDKIAWYENDGSESFTEHVISTSADFAFSVYAADVDGDGDMDVLSASSYDDKIAWYEQEGTPDCIEDEIELWGQNYSIDSTTIIDLNNSGLTGLIPTEVGCLSNLTTLLLQNNELSGEIPGTICDLNVDWTSPFSIMINNNQLCPPYPECIEDYVGVQDTSNCGSLSIIEDIIPLTYSLYNAYPNPFNPITTLGYDLSENVMVNITIYDIVGRQIKALLNSPQTAGYRSIQWNATNDNNQPVSAGLYLYTIQAGDYSQTKKMVLLK